MADRPAQGELAYWTSDTGIDGENPVEIDELDLIAIDPLPPYVWFQVRPDTQLRLRLRLRATGPTSADPGPPRNTIGALADKASKIWRRMRDSNREAC